MRFLAVDHGTRRVGLALGDADDGIIAMLPSFVATGDASAAQQVAKVAKEEGVEVIVVGMPAALAGGDGGAAVARVAAFVATLKKIADVRVETEDERMSTAFVERMHREAGSRKRSYDKDSAAAVVIAEGWISRRRTR